MIGILYMMILLVKDHMICHSYIIIQWELKIVINISLYNSEEYIDLFKHGRSAGRVLVSL